MNGHEQFAEDLALYALATSHGEEWAALEHHLKECAACRRELESLRGDASLLALSVSGPKPPARARQRLMDAIAREPRRQEVPQEAPKASGWRVLLPWFAAATLAIIAVVLWNQKTRLQSTIAVLRAISADQQLELQRARDVVSTLTATDALRMTLVAAKTPPQPQGKAFYVRERSSLVFLANNLPPLPPQKAYELWLIPAQGAPIPAGVFKPDAHGNAAVMNPPLPSGAEAKTFAITIEPEIGSAAPTMPIVMIGAGE